MEYNLQDTWDLKSHSFGSNCLKWTGVILVCFKKKELIKDLSILWRSALLSSAAIFSEKRNTPNKDMKPEINNSDF